MAEWSQELTEAEANRVRVKQAQAQRKKQKMKKLMIAAAAAAMVGGAFATCSDSVGCLAYDVKVTLKTLGYKTLTCKGTCADGAVEYYDNVTRTLQGYAWTCAYDCTCDSSSTIGSTVLDLVLWEAKAKLGWALYDTTVTAAPYTDQQLDMVKAIRYGKTGSKAAFFPFDITFSGTDWSTECALSAFTAGGTLSFAAVNGTVAKYSNLNNCAIKSISGYTIGKINADIRCTKSSSTTVKSLCGDTTTTVCCADKAPYYACICNCNVNWCLAAESVAAGEVSYVQDNVVPAVGTWTMKYNATLSKGNTAIVNKIPTYALK